MLDAEAIQSAVKRMVAAASGPSQVILFGSYARGTADEGSDLELLVRLPAPERATDQPKPPADPRPPAMAERGAAIHANGARSAGSQDRAPTPAGRRVMRRLGQMACCGLAWSSVLVLAPAAPPAAAQVNPLSALGRVVSTTIDARSKQDVAADTEIGAAASKQLLEDKAAEWAGVTVLVFQRHVVLAGAVKTEAVRKRVEELLRKDKRIRSLNNELLVGNVGSLARDTALEARINAALTAASGVSSVNMRWCATGGHVVLMGVAQSAGEAALANAKVRSIGGVKSIKSHLRVVARKK